MPRAADIAGLRSGRLVALAPTVDRVCGNVLWECRCDCGTFCTATVPHLREGRRVSSEPFNKVIRVVMGLVALIIVVSLLLSLIGHPLGVVPLRMR